MKSSISLHFVKGTYSRFLKLELILTQITCKVIFVKHKASSVSTEAVLDIQNDQLDLSSGLRGKCNSDNLSL